MHTKHRSTMSLANKVHREIAVYITTAPVNTMDIYSFNSSTTPHILFFSLMGVISVSDCVEIFTSVRNGTLFIVTQGAKKPIVPLFVNFFVISVHFQAILTSIIIFFKDLSDINLMEYIKLCLGSINKVEEWYVKHN
jgi:hypothetical protein